ncbi:carbamoyltransferase HypF [Gloeocapsopsis sp. IPPAS B-1203]|uniref:carbamoyltransferase HypF n=1 Tax=Gloeocapsopsis sp. IPPAS B-1203 TaxID=2049454 RepID=UPI0025A1D98F|nr:carbamoyltransferase HypF [Gloeocapsopsis sp. IPPAS B-1203]
METSYLTPVGYKQFEIRASTGGENTALILPDIATCADCLREIFDKRDRRYLYPFTNCTHCGPRFSIITALPYDRANTTMQKFEMCDRCQAEYHNPLNRRFHAQPNACAECGPHLELWQDGHVLTSHYQALQQAVEEIRKGKIVAIKGLGGFHLVVDARHQQAVTKLRYCKQRAKPFALMYPSLQLIKAHCEVSNLETQLLLSPQAPIVLLRRKLKSGMAIAPAVAPDNPYLGVMLPYTPLHHLLMSQLGFPVVATSGNLTDEPICIDEREAIQYLSHIATVFLIHNRPITRPIDDSVVRVIMERELLLRRARGYAPLPIAINLSLKTQQPQSKLLAVGAHFKNTIAFSLPQQVFVSQHIGDLATVAALKAFNQAIADFQQLYQLQPLTIACDAHPDYVSTQFAQNSGLPTIPVQHHYAHVLSCMAENDLLSNENSILGIAWDGTGYGLDGTIWGGEFLQIQPLRSLTSDPEIPFQRVAHLRTFRLPGGEKAIKEPRRVAIGLLYEIAGDALFTMNELAPVQAFNAQELRILRTMLQRNINTAITSSAGRLFDAIAAIIGLRQYTQFEGQAAMELEFAIAELNTDDCYSFEITTRANSPLIIDWMPTVQGVLADLSCELSQRYISAKFHNTLVEMMVVVAQQIGAEQVVLTGGCFQNKYLIERTIQRLTQESFHPYWHQQVPPHDGGIALGQIVAALRVI